MWNEGDGLQAGLSGRTDLFEIQAQHLFSGIEESLDLSKPGSAKQG